MDIPAKAPCKDCQVRHHGCHSECEQYAAWKDFLAAAKAEDRKDNESLAVIIGGIRKFKRQEHRHGKH